LSVRRAHWLAGNAELTSDTNAYYLRDSEEIAKAFAESPSAVASALELGNQLIASRPLAGCSC
jgi:hypothetical protein